MDSRQLMKEIREKEDLLHTLYVSHNNLMKYTSELEMHIWNEKDKKMSDDIKYLLSDYSFECSNGIINQSNIMVFVLVFEFGLILGMLFMWYLRS